MVNNSIAIIPARGGSKRIPEKNIVDFNGIPMIAKTIQAAKKTNLFRHVLVSTDDEKIAAVAKKYGVDIPEYYADLAKAFLRDKDFDGKPEEKLYLYYKTIVEQDD